MASQVNDVIYGVKLGTGANKSIASSAYGECTTASNTAAKVVDMTGFVLVSGITIHVKFTNSNTAENPTLNVNSKGAKPIMRYGTTNVGTTEYTSWKAGSIISLTYDGTNWQMNDYSMYDTDTKNTAGATDTSSKIFLVGATAQTANPQTYSDDQVYTTNGTLTTNKVQVGVGQATMEYNSTLKSIDFVFT